MSDETPFIILDVAPKFDTATQYSFEWNRLLLEKIGDMLDITTLLEDEAVRANFRREIPNHDVLFFFDHGNETNLIGQDATSLFSTANLKYLKGKRVFAMACLTAKNLGIKAVENGTKEWWGAVDSIGFTLDDAPLFGEVFIDGAYARFVERKEPDEVLQSMKSHFDLQKDKSENPWTKIWLEKDRDMWVVLLENDIPPVEKSWWEKLINAFLAWIDSLF